MIWLQWQNLKVFVGYEIIALLAAIVLAVAHRLLTGSINTKGLLQAKTDAGHQSGSCAVADADRVRCALLPAAGAGNLENSDSTSKTAGVAIRTVVRVGRQPYLVPALESGGECAKQVRWHAQSTDVLPMNQKSMFFEKRIVPYILVFAVGVGGYFIAKWLVPGGGSASMEDLKVAVGWGGALLVGLLGLAVVYRMFN